MEPEDPKYSVTLHIYDLSQGMAKNMSKMFLGKQIDGIWHTGIVVYGQEYYFGGGICAGPPKQTPFGFPTKIESIGETQIPKEIFLDFLHALSSKFTLNTYDLFKNNCNNFTEECCQFLTGMSIPSYISGLPSEVLNTPLGKMIEPMINNIQNQMINGSNSQLIPEMVEGNMNPQALNFPASQNIPNSLFPGVHEINDSTDFFKIIQNNPAVVIDFFSLTCPPCMKIKPIYAQIAQETYQTCPKINFSACNISQVRDLATQLAVSSIPTFLFYHNGNLIHRFSGANEAELRNQIQNLKNLVGTQPQPKLQVNEPVKKSPYQLCLPANYEFYLYKTEKKDFPVNKIKNLVPEKIRENEHVDTFLELALNIDNAFQYFIPEKKKFLLSFVCSNLMNYIEKHSDEAIPFYDLLRIMMAENSYSSIFFENFLDTFNKLLDFLKKDQEKDFQLISRPIKILILRIISNAFSSEAGKNFMVKKHEEILELIKRIYKFYAKSDKMCIETCVMIQLNYLISKGIVSKEKQNEILEMLLEIGKNEDGSDNISLGVVLSINFMCFRDKTWVEVMQKNEIEKILAKAKSSKNEKVVFAAKDTEYILEGKA